MKPSWSDAPEWAKYRSQSLNGGWVWHEFKPVAIERRYNSMTGRSCECDIIPGWRDTLEPRQLDKS